MEKEKRLIDANKAQAVLVNMAEHLLEAGNPEMAGAVGYAAEVIGKQKTVDAVEVVHAHWDNNGICTLCGYPIPTDSKYDFIDKDDCLFCYHCGAIMNGGNADGICKED